MRNWPEDVPLYIPDYESIPVHEFLKRSARDYSDRKAIIFYGRAVSYAEFDDLASYADRVHDFKSLIKASHPTSLGRRSTWQRTSTLGKWSSVKHCRRRSSARYSEEN